MGAGGWGGGSEVVQSLCVCNMFYFRRESCVPRGISGLELISPRLVFKAPGD